MNKVWYKLYDHKNPKAEDPIATVSLGVKVTDEYKKHLSYIVWY